MDSFRALLGGLGVAGISTWLVGIKGVSLPRLKDEVVAFIIFGTIVVVITRSSGKAAIPNTLDGAGNDWIVEMAAELDGAVIIALFGNRPHKFLKIWAESRCFAKPSNSFHRLGVVKVVPYF